MKSILGTALLTIASGALLASEWDAERRSRPATATVLESLVHGRSGKTIATVAFAVDGRERYVVATLRAWYCHLSPGERIPIRYSASDPESVEPGWFWQRHFASTLALAVLAIVATAKVMSRMSSRNRRSLALLRDD